MAAPEENALRNTGAIHHEHYDLDKDLEVREMSPDPCVQQKDLLYWKLAQTTKVKERTTQKN